MTLNSQILEVAGKGTVLLHTLQHHLCILTNFLQNENSVVLQRFSNSLYISSQSTEMASVSALCFICQRRNTPCKSSCISSVQINRQCFMLGASCCFAQRLTKKNLSPLQTVSFAQAAKEVAHLQSSQLWSTKNQSTSSASTDLPIWQEQALTHLNLWGPNANLEVTLGGVPPVDPRLLAAVRILYCKDPSELQGRALAHLGAWGAFLNPANEVNPFTFIIWAVYSCRHDTRGQVLQR